MSKNKKNLFIIAVLAVILIILIAVRLNPVLHPSGNSLLKKAFEDQVKSNSMRGSLKIYNKATVHIDKDEDLAATASTSASITVNTDIPVYAMDKDTLRIEGDTTVKYADIISTTDYFTVYKNLNKPKQYVYYSSKVPDDSYISDYEKWAALDTQKNTIKNFPKSLRDSFTTLKDTGFKDLGKDKGFIVTGSLPKGEMLGLLRYFCQTDTKNTCLMRGVSFGKKTADTVRIVFDKNRVIKSADITLKQASAGRSLDIETLTIKMTFDENKENIAIPKTLSSETLDTDFSVSTPEEKVSYSMPNSTKKTVKMASFEDLNITYEDHDALTLDKLKNLILASDKVVPLSSKDEDKSMVTTTLTSDPDAGFYFYTEDGELTQIAFDGSYAKNVIPIKINGMGLGTDMVTVNTIMGTPAQVTSDNSVTTYTYKVGNNDYEVSLTFYQKDGMVNGGLQRISIIRK